MAVSTDASGAEDPTDCLAELDGCPWLELSQKVAGPPQDLRGPVTSWNWLKLSCHRRQYARQLSHGHPIAAPVIACCYVGRIRPCQNKHLNQTDRYLGVNTTLS